MAAKDPETRAHLDWLGMLQPVGLVVSPPALVKGQALVPRNTVELQRRFVAALGPKLETETESKPKPKPRRAQDQAPPARLRDFARFVVQFFDWEGEDLVGGDALPKSLEVSLPEYQQILAPTWAIQDPEASEDEPAWLALIVEVEADTTSFDEAGRDSHGRRASPQRRLEWLLLETKIDIGLLVSAHAIRLVYAPTSGSSGHLSFPIAAMAEVGGRPILAALHMLLCAERLFTLPRGRRLPALLVESRKYQNEVSNRLSEQVLRALGELLRGFGAADDIAKGELLGETAREDPQHIYGGLITTMMRLVFLLYAEERELMSQDQVYVQHYGVSGLFEQLRADAGMYPDTMDQRFGAWARLLSLFRLVFDGGAHGSMRLPARTGQLFNPDTYPFLEGRPYRVTRVLGERIEPPRVSDGVVYRVLEDLLLLAGERLSYRSLDVEQIGSVYEGIMGFEIERAFGPSIALRPQHVVVNLRELLDAKPKQRAKLLDIGAGCKLSKGDAKVLAGATNVDELVAALGRRISPQTPTPLAPGSLYLQPTEERRRSGSHYTPRALTEPVVRKTLAPLLAELGPRATPEQILALKVCDPAMGSGAFLVEACRQLGKALARSWDLHGAPPELSADDDAPLYARRLVAEHCIYGVDKNPFAVNLAKLSLWLVTLARDHTFSFVDHALKSGDSLIGLGRRQIAECRWGEASEDHDGPLFAWMREQVVAATQARMRILDCRDERDAEKRLWHREAEDALDRARRRGDATLSALLHSTKAKQRENQRAHMQELLTDADGAVRHAELDAAILDYRERYGPPFHWEIEFPELFDRANPGFHAIVGNPPFQGGRVISASHGTNYLKALMELYPGASGGTDLSAYFLRRAYGLLREGGCFGLIATNTISQGDTRVGGLAVLRSEGANLYDVRRRVEWPGAAAVIVSVIHCRRGATEHKRIDGAIVDDITAFLMPSGPDVPPQKLAREGYRCFQGNIVLGIGFTFDDKSDKATPLAELGRLLEADPSNQERVFPYLGGREVNDHPAHQNHRYVINFEEMSEAEARRWPDLFALLEAKVYPERATKDAKKYPRMVHEWWKYWCYRTELYEHTKGFERVLVVPLISKHLSICLLPADYVISHKLAAFSLEGMAAFAILQSRVHEIWARFFSSTLGDGLNYSPTDCFETYPFPTGWEANEALERAGQRYYDYRAQLMLRTETGLTKTYNRFHDRDEDSPEIQQLRELHEAMDHAVLEAFGWSELAERVSNEFQLEYEVAEDEGGGRSKKKPWRYKWPERVHDEVLARLLALNHQRVVQRVVGRAATDKSSKKKCSKRKRTKRKTKRKPSATQPALFDEPDDT